MQHSHRLSRKEKIKLTELGESLYNKAYQKACEEMYDKAREEEKEIFENKIIN